jgi:hypothetical protein
MGAKIYAIRKCPTSHLFCYWVEIMKVEGWQILFMFRVFSQESTFVSLLAGTHASSPKRFLGWHFGFSMKKKPTFSNLVTPFWVRYVPSCTWHIKSTFGLPIVYFLLMPPTQQLWSTWQNQNLCNSIAAPLASL